MKEFNCSQTSGRDLSCRLAKLVGGLFYGTAAMVASAQTADGDVINLTAGLGVTRDSNVLRINEAVPTQPYGGDKRGDTYLKGNLGISFDRLISQQRLTASAEVERFQFREYSDFNNTGYNAGANLDWVIGRPFFGRIGGRIYKYQPLVQDRAIGTPAARDRNDVERQNFYLNGGMRLTPSWSVIAGWDIDRRRNSSSLYEDSDLDFNTLEAGVRYAPGTGLELDLVYRRTDGDYKINQVNGLDGLPLLSGPRSNDFKQNALLARVQYRPSEDSRIAGRIGYTKRGYDTDSSRDFSGVTTGFDIELAQTGALRWLITLQRDIEPEDTAITATYADSRSFRVMPTIQATGKVRISPFFHYVDRRYKGEGSLNERTEKYNIYGVTVNYEIRRNLNAIFDLRRESRNSNIDILDFDANIVSAGIQVRF
ncbi:MAG: outer membrane beta-barrel protein [Lautropia sp.]